MRGQQATCLFESLWRRQYSNWGMRKIREAVCFIGGTAALHITESAPPLYADKAQQEYTPYSEFGTS